MDLENFSMMTKENVAKFIREYYEQQDSTIHQLLKEFVKEIPKEAIDFQKILAETIQSRSLLRKNIDAYEEQLVEIIDLSFILSSNNHNLPEELYADYMEYLLQRINKTIPDVLEMIQMLK